MSSTEPLGALGFASIDAGRSAVFLDFDGTLVEIADHPDRVIVAPETREVLAHMYTALGGALAIVTGREVTDIDRFLAPLRLPVAGDHGLSRRSSTGELRGPSVNRDTFRLIAQRLEPFVACLPGLLLELKSGSVALHFRGRPELQRDCNAAVAAAIADIPHIELLRGKMVIEVKADAADKGGAIADYLSEAPFVGRTPLFAGDDATDEDAIAAVNERGGITIKVGPGETRARYRADSSRQFMAWLTACAGKL